jgi:NitT/TauT family transport system permease protein
VVAIACWQAMSGRLVPEFWIASPSAIWHSLVTMDRTGQLVGAVRVTAEETVLGFLLGSAAGLAAGLILGISPIVARILDPYLVGANSIPRVALVPLMILWLGIGFETKVVFASLLVFFPVFMNTIAGVRDVDEDLIDVLRVMGAHKIQVIYKLIIPSALVWVFAGLRMSIPFALIGAVMAEMFASNAGLGYLLSLSANNFDTAGSFAALLVITVLGLVLTAIVGQVERRTMRWRSAGH